MFGELGYEAATFQEIAERADLTRPAINHYFPSKRSLYREVVEQTNQMAIAAGVEQAESESTFSARLRTFIRATVGTQDDNPSVAAFLVTSVLESQRNPELRHDGNAALQATRGFLDWALREAAAIGELRPDVDVEVAADTLLAMLWGLGFFAGFIGPHDRFMAVTDEFLRILRGGTLLRTS